MYASFGGNESNWLNENFFAADQLFLLRPIMNNSLDQADLWRRFGAGRTELIGWLRRFFALATLFWATPR
jgi:hypothetical protein